MSGISSRLAVQASRSRLPHRAWTLPALDVLMAAGLAGAAFAGSVGDHTLVHPWTEVLAVSVVAPIALRTRAPLAMALLVAAGFVGFGSLPGTGTPLWSFLGVLVIGFSVGANLTGRRRGGALAALVAATYFVQVADVARGVAQLSWAEVYITPPVLVLAPALAGWLLQRSVRQTAELRRVSAELAEERERHAQAAADAERSRIARELHDIISHSVSVMVVQAGAAENLLDEESPARAQVRAVRETGREALAELRRQLGLLQDGAHRSAAPMPSLRDLPRLVESMAADLDAVGAVDELDSPGLELAVYRVVQESLTNARRHAGGGAVQVRLARRPDQLEVTVLDAGGVPAHPEIRGTGNGLAGIRERVALYGGSVEAGPRRRGGGWRVHARFPLGGAG